MAGQKEGKGGNGLQPYDDEGKYTNDDNVGSSPSNNEGDGKGITKWFSLKLKRNITGNKLSAGGRYDDYDNLSGGFAFTLKNFKENRERRAKEKDFGEISPGSPKDKLIRDPEVRIHIEDIIRDNSAICINCNFKYLNDIIKDGYKNQFSFEGSHTGGASDKASRARQSHKMFGTDIGDIDKSDEFYEYNGWGEHYEKYGCLLNKNKLERISSRASCYGDSIIELKPSIKSRTTYCFGDSLYTDCAPQLIGGKLDRGVFAQPGYKVPDKEMVEKWKTPKDIYQGFEIYYIETQFHGSITSSDIDNIMAPLRHWKSSEGKKTLELCALNGISAYSSYNDEKGEKRLCRLDIDKDSGDIVFHDDETGELISPVISDKIV